MDSYKIVKEKYIFDYEGGFFTIRNPDGKKIATFPLSVRLSLSDGNIFEEFEKPLFYGDKIEVPLKTSSNIMERASLTFDLADDEIVISFRALANEDFCVDEFEYLRHGKFGMSMNDKSFAFSPAPRSAGGHGTTLYKFPCDSSMDSLFAPPPFLMMCGNRFGNISWALLDMPNSYIFKHSEKLGIIAEKPCGKITTKKCEVYTPPRLLITFPEDEWDALSIYYQKLNEKGCINPIPQEKKNYPDWWKRFVVDSYGDQITSMQYNVYASDDWSSPNYNTDWLFAWLDKAEKRLGRRDFNIVIDAFWQYEMSLDPYPDKTRFENLREFIDYAHQQGHKVLLWIIPFIPDNNSHLAKGEQTLAEKFQVLRKNKNGSSSIDYTHKNIEKYMDEFCRILFSDGEDCLNCDGIKLDGPFCIGEPQNTEYQNPEVGIGAKESMHHYLIFEKCANKYKKDVLLNTSIVNPFFENHIHICRLGDQSTREEREQRARIQSIVSPNMLTDSDNVENSDNIKKDYLAATVYSVPYLYHTDEFLKGDRPTDATMRALGNLLSLSEKKPFGRPIFKSYGNWQWESDGKITAACFDYDTIIVFSKEKIAYVFSWTSGEKKIPLFGHKTPNNNCDTITLFLKEGEIKTFEFI